jgi:hypothetical protein
VRQAVVLLLVFFAGVTASRLGIGTRLRHSYAAVRSKVGDLRTPAEDRQRPAGPGVRASTPDGVALWVVDDSTKVFPGDDLGHPRSSEGANEPVRLEGAPGETVAFQMVLASGHAVPRVRVEWADLDGSDGRIPRSRIEVFRESYIRCPDTEEKVVGLGAGEYPDALIPLYESGPESTPLGSPFALAPHRNQPLWVDLVIPRGTPAGLYRGAVAIAPGDHSPMSLPLELTVYPFEIPARRSLNAWVPLYATRLWNREDLDGIEDEEAGAVVQRYMVMAHEHRFDSQIKEDEPDLEWDDSTGALLDVDWSRYDALNGPALDGSLFEDGEPPRLWKVGGGHWWGMRPGDPPNFGGYHKADSDLRPAHRRALDTYAKEIARHFTEKGWTGARLFFYPIDEPDLEARPNYANLVKAYGETLKSSGTGIGQLVTMAPYWSPVPLGFVDIWATTGGGYFPRLMAERQKLGEQTWFYQQHEPFLGGQSVNNEGLGMRSWAWIAWRYRADGIFLWAGNFWNEDPYRDPENWSRNLLGNGILFYPGRLLSSLGLPARRGPIPSFRMKALRRGLLDYEYFQLLRSLGGDPDPLVARVVRSALNDEETYHSWQHSRWARHGDWVHESARWDAVRREVAAEICRRMGQ